MELFFGLISLIILICVLVWLHRTANATKETATQLKKIYNLLYELSGKDVSNVPTFKCEWCKKDLPIEEKTEWRGRVICKACYQDGIDRGVIKWE
ncbi:MAG: hypothetical protein JRH08_00815 [Deltaproteobacteria bacterium]|nr:hypothetical protein [Deltaproteobacteria bacterium]MBW2025704.1 hypothetical protein [Deltaproteobacteria bacterium]MBW2124245.1 hypothetical protein [Deltaproteobacteria bacterium]